MYTRIDKIGFTKCKVGIICPVLRYLYLLFSVSVHNINTYNENGFLIR